MIGSSETMGFDPDVFNKSFFDQYQEQLADISFDDQASKALADIMTIQKYDGTQKTYEEIIQQTQTFFESDWVRNNEILMNRMAVEFAQACMSHNHGAQLAHDGRLESYFESGLDGMPVNNQEVSYGRSTDTNDNKPNSRNAKKKKKKSYDGWFRIFRT